MLKVHTISVKDAPKINIERVRGGEGGFGLKAYFALTRLSEENNRNMRKFWVSQGLLSRIVV
jgi:hypothetical protein